MPTNIEPITMPISIDELKKPITTPRASLGVFNVTREANVGVPVPTVIPNIIPNKINIK